MISVDVPAPEEVSGFTPRTMTVYLTPTAATALRGLELSMITAEEMGARAPRRHSKAINYLLEAYAAGVPE